MKDQNKTKEQLIAELEEIKRKFAELEASLVMLKQQESAGAGSQAISKAEVLPRNRAVRYDKSGKPSGVEGVFADITASKWAEHALRESEEKYRILVETAQEAIIVEQDGIHKFVNPATAGIWGRSEEELLSRPFWEFMHPDDREMVVDRASRRLRGEKVPSRYAHRVLTEDGETRWVEINSAMFSWEDRPALLVFATNITERKQAEEALRKAKEDLEIMVLERTAELRKANEQLQWELTERKKAEEAADRANKEWERTFNDISDCIMVLDDQHRIVRANKAMCGGLGMLPGELIGRFCFELVHGQEAPPAFCPHSQLLSNGKEHSAEVMEPRLGGICDVRVSPVIGKNNRVVGSVHISRDITERKKAEEEIKASLKEKEALLREIHHRVRNNLTVVSSFLRIQSRQAKDDYHREMFNKSQDRIATIALVHETLYQTGNLSSVSSMNYLQGLTSIMSRK